MRYIFCSALLAVLAFAQTKQTIRKGPEQAVQAIEDVQLGMSRDHVLAGLSNKYELTRIDDSKSASAQNGSEYWMVFPKSFKSLQDLTRDGGAIRFWQGTVASIEIKVYSSLPGESTGFSESLFWLIYNRADPLVSSDKSVLEHYKEVRARTSTLPVELEDQHDDKGEVLTLKFGIGGQDFKVTLEKKPSQSDEVTIERIVCCATLDAK